MVIQHLYYKVNNDNKQSAECEVVTSAVVIIVTSSRTIMIVGRANKVKDG